ncbi:MAG: shikimate dehydrogenase [Bacteroidaceae bacterium]|nr:shikimate dehydrogenase [Bacteroidaceae bacterium]
MESFGGIFPFLIILGIIIFKSVFKKLDVLSDDFPNVGTDKDSVEKPDEKPEQSAIQVSADRLFGLIGKPLGHSKSEQLFKTRFNREHISADYCNFELDSIEELPGIISANPNLCGFNVTIPYKEAVIPFLDELDESARAVGAVNTVKVTRDGSSVRLTGYNTDCTGFMESIKEHVGERRKALILGTGGVSKAVKHAFDLLGIESRFVSRNSTFDTMGYYELSPSIMDEYQIIVNCTPVGMYPNNDQCPDIPYSFLSAEHLVYDVIYNPQETLFMKKSREYGATAIGGENMFELQAAASWKIWNEK